MASPIITATNALETVLGIAKLDATGIIGETLLKTDFEIEQSFLPRSRLQDLVPEGKLWIVCLDSDENRITRGRAYRKEVPIQLGYQQLVEDTDKTTITLLINLVDQLRRVCKNAFAGDSSILWVRTEALKDETGTPYNFVGLRESTTFESYFTVYYELTQEG